MRSVALAGMGSPEGLCNAGMTSPASPSAPRTHELIAHTHTPSLTDTHAILTANTHTYIEQHSPHTHTHTYTNEYCAHMHSIPVPTVKLKTHTRSLPPSSTH